MARKRAHHKLPDSSDESSVGSPPMTRARSLALSEPAPPAKKRKTNASADKESKKSAPTKKTAAATKTTGRKPAAKSKVVETDSTYQGTVGPKKRAAAKSKPVPQSIPRLPTGRVRYSDLERIPGTGAYKRRQGIERARRIADREYEKKMKAQEEGSYGKPRPNNAPPPKPPVPVTKSAPKKPEIAPLFDLSAKPRKGVRVTKEIVTKPKQPVNNPYLKSIAASPNTSSKTSNPKLDKAPKRRILDDDAETSRVPKKRKQSALAKVAEVAQKQRPPPARPPPARQPSARQAATRPTSTRPTSPRQPSPKPPSTRQPSARQPSTRPPSARPPSPEEDGQRRSPASRVPTPETCDLESLNAKRAGIIQELTRGKRLLTSAKCQVTKNTNALKKKQTEQAKERCEANLREWRPVLENWSVSMPRLAKDLKYVEAEIAGINEAPQGTSGGKINCKKRKSPDESNVRPAKKPANNQTRSGATPARPSGSGPSSESDGASDGERAAQKGTPSPQKADSRKRRRKGKKGDTPSPNRPCLGFPTFASSPSGDAIGEANSESGATPENLGTAVESIEQAGAQTACMSTAGTPPGSKRRSQDLEVTPVQSTLSTIQRLLRQAEGTEGFAADDGFDTPLPRRSERQRSPSQHVEDTAAREVSPLSSGTPSWAIDDVAADQTSSSSSNMSKKRTSEKESSATKQADLETADMAKKPSPTPSRVKKTLSTPAESAVSGKRSKSKSPGALRKSPRLKSPPIEQFLIPFPSKETDFPRPVGLTNWSNACFANAAIQFFDAILRGHDIDALFGSADSVANLNNFGITDVECLAYDKDLYQIGLPGNLTRARAALFQRIVATRNTPQQPSLVQHFRRLLVRLHRPVPEDQNGRRFISPLRFQQIFPPLVHPWEGDHMNGAAQEDSSEYLSKLSVGLQNDVSQLASNLGQLMNQKLSIMRQCMNEKCGHVLHRRTDLNQTKILPVPKTEEVFSLRRLFQDCLISNIDETCPKCGGSMADYETYIQAPPNLILSFGRVETNRSDKNNPKKIMTKIDYSETITILGVEYEVTAIVRHDGKTTKRGHYTVFRKHEGGWYLIDDRDVYLIPGEPYDSMGRDNERAFTPGLVSMILMKPILRKDEDKNISSKVSEKSIHSSGDESEEHSESDDEPLPVKNPSYIPPQRKTVAGKGPRKTPSNLEAQKTEEDEEPQEDPSDEEPRTTVGGKRPRKAPSTLHPPETTADEESHEAPSDEEPRSTVGVKAPRKTPSTLQPPETTADEQPRRSPSAEPRSAVADKEPRKSPPVESQRPVADNEPRNSPSDQEPRRRVADKEPRKHPSVEPRNAVANKERRPGPPIQLWRNIVYIKPFTVNPSKLIAEATPPRPPSMDPRKNLSNLQPSRKIEPDKSAKSPLQQLVTCSTDDESNYSEDELYWTDCGPNWPNVELNSSDNEPKSSDDEPNSSAGGPIQAQEIQKNTPDNGLKLKGLANISGACFSNASIQLLDAALESENLDSILGPATDVNNYFFSPDRAKHFKRIPREMWSKDMISWIANLDMAIEFNLQHKRSTFNVVRHFRNLLELLHQPSEDNYEGPQLFQRAFGAFARRDGAANPNYNGIDHQEAAEYLECILQEFTKDPVQPTWHLAELFSHTTARVETCMCGYTSTPRETSESEYMRHTILEDGSEYPTLSELIQESRGSMASHTLPPNTPKECPECNEPMYEFLAFPKLPRYFMMSIYRVDDHGNKRTNPVNLTAPVELQGEQYELIAVVAHAGEAHYVCDRKLNGQWWNIDDDIVTLEGNEPPYDDREGSRSSAVVLLKRVDKTENNNFGAPPAGKQPSPVHETSSSGNLVGISDASKRKPKGLSNIGVASFSNASIQILDAALETEDIDTIIGPVTIIDDFGIYPEVARRYNVQYGQSWPDGLQRKLNIFRSIIEWERSDNPENFQLRAVSHFRNLLDVLRNNHGGETKWEGPFLFQYTFAQFCGIAEFECEDDHGDPRSLPEPYRYLDRILVRFAHDPVCPAPGLAALFRHETVVVHTCVGCGYQSSPAERKTALIRYALVSQGPQNCTLQDLLEQSENQIRGFTPQRKTSLPDCPACETYALLPVKTFIQTPQYLLLATWRSRERPPTEENLVQLLPTLKIDKDEYELIAVITRHGHPHSEFSYTCDRKHNGQWWNIDNTQVRPIGERPTPERTYGRMDGSRTTSITLFKKVSKAPI